jgi:uncharacterized Ntn-hydrolase superfamily protein
MTYSLVARDASTGELGVAVQSHWFSVGSIVSWAEAGVGAVATQSVAERAYGPRLLERMAAGAKPRDALESLLSDDPAARVRQVACVDSDGRVAVHTGEGCIPDAGHLEGDGFSAQANMMRSPEVWPRMAAAFESAEGPLSRRLVAALDAGEEAGGDMRGRQSAALLVAPGAGEPWRRLVDLRVEDHPEPLAELHRLLDLRDAYELADEGDELTGRGDHDSAGDRYRAASELAPESTELRFWAAVADVRSGDRDGGLERIRRLIDEEPGWAELIRRVPPEMAPDAGELREALGL